MDYYLYSHSNADGIFYIGKGCKDRARDSFLSRRKSEWHEAAKDGYTSKIEANGTEDDILSLEKVVIKSLLNQGVKLVNKVHNPDWSGANFGNKHTDKAKKKMSDKAKQRTGEKNNFFGKTNKSAATLASHIRWQKYKFNKANNYRRENEI